LSTGANLRANAFFHSLTYVFTSFDTWMGREGTISWPLRSPDLIQLGLLFWEFM